MINNFQILSFPDMAFQIVLHTLWLSFCISLLYSQNIMTFMLQKHDRFAPIFCLPVNPCTACSSPLRLFFSRAEWRLVFGATVKGISAQIWKSCPWIPKLCSSTPSPAMEDLRNIVSPQVCRKARNKEEQFYPLIATWL